MMNHYPLLAALSLQFVFTSNLFQSIVWVVTLVQAKIRGRTATRRWQKQNAHREHRIAPKANWRALPVKSRKLFFYKRCGTQGNDCRPTDHPTCPSSMFGFSFSSDDKCCTGNNCNSGQLNKISGLLTGISIFLVLWGLFTFLKWSALFVFYPPYN